MIKTLCFAALCGSGYYAYTRGWISIEKLTNWLKPPVVAKTQNKAPTPVLTAEVRQGDMSLYLKGLGSVTALYTVTVHCRVDGELMKVDFIEGQMVSQGELLAEIDPRPFQVQLKQAEGNLIKDQAALQGRATRHGSLQRLDRQ